MSCFIHNMKCWICNNEANSGEHLIKASDLKSVFGNITQKFPLFLHSEQRRNQPIPGIKSNKLKYNARLCANCNNKLTQRHDLACEKLSNYLRNRQPHIKPKMLIRLNRTFPGSVSKSMLAVHLYFLKLFGCLITENDVPINIDQFAQSILRGIPHPKVWLAFRTGLQHPNIKHVGCSHVETVQLGGRVVFASWFYVIDKLAINVMYSEPGEHRRGLVDAWHPSHIGKHIRISSQ